MLPLALATQAWCHHRYIALKEHRTSPAWLCWLKHAQYLSILVQHVITRADLDSLRVLIGEHQELFAEVSL